MWVQVCVGAMFLCMSRPWVNNSVLRHPTLLLTQVLPVNLELTNWLDWLDTKLQRLARF